MLVCVFLHNFAHETADAARIRHSPRPLISRRETTSTTRAHRAAGSRSYVFSLAPRLRGEGWGEGLLPQANSLRVPLTRRCAPTSPRKRLSDSHILKSQRGAILDAL